MASSAKIKYVIEKDKYGNDCDAVYAECLSSGDMVGPVWGTNRASVRRALAMLTEECSCFENWHEAEEHDWKIPRPKPHQIA